MDTASHRYLKSLKFFFHTVFRFSDAEEQEKEAAETGKPNYSYTTVQKISITCLIV